MFLGRYEKKRIVVKKVSQNRLTPPDMARISRLLDEGTPTLTRRRRPGSEQNIGYLTLLIYGRDTRLAVVFVAAVDCVS